MGDGCRVLSPFIFQGVWGEQFWVRYLVVYGCIRYNFQTPQVFGHQEFQVPKMEIDFPKTLLFSANFWGVVWLKSRIRKPYIHTAYRCFGFLHLRNPERHGFVFVIQGKETKQRIRWRSNFRHQALRGVWMFTLKIWKKAGGCFPKESYGNNMRKGCTLGGSLKIPLKLYTVIEK